MAWNVRPSEPEAARSLGRACGVGSAVAQVLLHRGVTDAEAAQAFLEPRLAMLTPPDAMVDREAAADRIVSAIRSRERIVVFGDYDVDGTTSAAILADIIEALGGDVVAMVARRFEGGYGFSDEALERAVTAGARLIVTCDFGSSDHERIARAKAQGIDVVVVDHHLVPEEPLPALAFLNPHRPECGFPYKGLASAGLVLSLGAALRKGMGTELDLRGWLDLVALGTIADVAPLSGDNRVLVRAGLERLSDPGARPGIRALREVAQVKAPRLGATDVSFRLAPRLNAAGRLADPQVTLDLLRARSMDAARGLAAEVERLNVERRVLERRVTEEARAEALRRYGEPGVAAVVVGAEGWHRGVVGITAARLVDAFHAPALVTAFQGDLGHGSGRAPEGFPLHDVLKAASEHLERFGGHQAAVGFSVRRDRFEAFREAFESAAAVVGPSHRPMATADVVLGGDAFPLPSVNDLERLEPTGEANPEPLFAVDAATVVKAQRVGDGGAHLKLELKVGASRLSAFGYEQGERSPTAGSQIRALGSLRPDGWRGGENVELRLEDWEPA